MGSFGVGARLRIVTGIAVVSLLAVFLIGLYNVQELRASREFLHTNIMPSIESNNEVQREFLNLRLAVLYHITRQEPEKKQLAEDQVAEARAKIVQEIEHYEKDYVVDDQDRGFLLQQRQALSDYMSAIAGPLKYSRENDQARLWA